MIIKKNGLPFVSLIVPCRNEEYFISKCLDSLIKQDYPADNYEVIIVDGKSEDKTKEIINGYLGKHTFLKLIDNPQKFTPIAVNLGIRECKGDIISKTDAHTIYPSDYISKGISYLLKYEADCVGGIAMAKSEKETLISKSTALAFTSRFGSASAFRIGVGEPKWTDTAFGCFYDKDLFKKIGYFNENLIRSQDIEFNLRLKKSGGKILLAPDIITYYYPKSKLKDFFCHNFSDGIWAIYPLKFVKKPMKFRHYIPLIFVLSLIISAILSIISPFFIPFLISIILFYVLLSIFFSAEISIKEKDIKYLLTMPLIFSIRHFSYGLGSIWGTIKLFT